MATTFKTFSNNDKTTTRTLLHEAIPLTGAIFSGTYIADEGSKPENIKTYAHGMFQSVYDYPYLSSSANHIMDITCGFSTGSALSQSAVASYGTQQTKKVNIYNSMAQQLMGYDIDGQIREFDRDGTLNDNKGKLREVFFLNFARLLVKDEIKKGSFQLAFNTGSHPTASMWDDGQTLTIADHNAATNYFTNSPAGEYGILYTASSTADGSGFSGVGLIFYQAGIAVLTCSIFSNAPTGSDNSQADGEAPGLGQNHATEFVSFGDPLYTIKGGSHEYENNHISEGFGETGVQGMLTGSTIDNFAAGIRNRVRNVQFNNTTELNSTIYFCRANHNDFNYSSNPTYIDSSRLVVKESSLDNPVTYITTIGLYSADNELLAVAKLSEPLKKDPTNELTLRVRLDY